MTTWHDRLQEALDARKLDWSDLIKPTGKTKPSVYAWKPTDNDRSTMMNADNAALICEFLKINALWLFHGRGPSGIERIDDPPKSPGYVQNTELKYLRAAEPQSVEYHLTNDENTLLTGYRLAGEETKNVLLQAATGVIARFSGRRETND